MRGSEPVQAWRQPARDVGGNAGDTNVRAVASIDAGERVAKLEQSTPHPGREPFAFRRHLDAPCVAHEQGDAEFLFQGSDAVTDGARRDAKLIAGVLEAFVTLDRFKDAQRFQRWQATHRHLQTAPDLWSPWRRRSVTEHA